MNQNPERIPRPATERIVRQQTERVTKPATERIVRKSPDGNAKPSTQRIVRKKNERSEEPVSQRIVRQNTQRTVRQPSNERPQRPTTDRTAQEPASQRIVRQNTERVARQPDQARSSKSSSSDRSAIEPVSQRIVRQNTERGSRPPNGEDSPKTNTDRSAREPVSQGISKNDSGRQQHPSSAALPANLEIPEQLDGYRVIRELGRGGMSIVYLAKHRAMDREVAIKVLNPDQAADKMIRHRFIREGRLGGCISHTNVIQHLDMREDSGWHCLALEYVAGGNLKQLLRRHNSQMPERLALGLVRDVACGLEAIARAGVVHRDIKPANIFMTEDMIPKVADFGVAIAAAAGLQKRDVERKRGIVIGSPRYMPPEQADPEAHLDARADIHALGATLWELLFGETPYSGPSVRDILEKLVFGPVPDPLQQNRQVSRRTAAVLSCCLSKNANDRYQTPRALVTAIDLALHSRATQELSAPDEDAYAATPAADVSDIDDEDTDAEDTLPEITEDDTISNGHVPPIGLPFTWTQF